MNADRVQAIADELLRHDIDGNNTHTCLCGEALWTNGNHEGNTSMARHRAVNIVRVLDEMTLQDSVQDVMRGH